MTLHWRPATMSDLDEVTRVSNASERHDRRPEITPRSAWQRDFTGPGTDLGRDTLLVEREGEAVGFGFCHVPSEPPRTHLFAFLWTYAAPDARAAIGDELVTRMAETGTTRLAPVTTTAERLLRTSVTDHQAEDAARLERLGFSATRWFVIMNRPLDAELPQERERAGEVLLRAWREGDIEPTRAVHNAAFVDHWGSGARSAHEWRAETQENDNFRPDLSSVATDGGRPVGYLLAHHFPQDAEVTGRHELWISLVGVLATHRGRGLAGALLARALHQARAAGFAWAGLDVDSGSPTGAGRLYERLGFRRTGTSVTYVREIE